MIANPLALFATVTAALRREDWAAAARLCDPVSLTSFRRQLMEQFQPQAPLRELTVEQYLGHMPGMPREVAEYHVAEHNRQRDSLLRLTRELPGVRSVEEIAGLAPADVFATWLKGRSPRTQMEQLIKRGQATLSDAQQTLDVAGAEFLFKYVALGVVPDGERLAHVLYRWADQGDTSDNPAPETESWIARLPNEEQEFVLEVGPRLNPQVVSCRRQADGSWCALVDFNFFGVGNLSYGIGVDESEPSASADPE